MTKISPNILKYNSLHIQELSLSSINAKKKKVCKHIVVKILNFQNKKNILKEVLEK